MACIASNFSALPETIVRLEDTNVPIFHQLDLIEKLLNDLSDNGSAICNSVKSKFELVLKKNPGYERIKKISRMIQGTSEEGIDLSPHQIASFKFAPLASVDVERSFSSFKQLYRDNRHSFTFENLKMHVIIHCNNKEL